MKKFLISRTRQNKINWINNVTEFKKIIVLFKKDKEILDDIKHDYFYYAEDLGRSIQFLDFQSKVMNNLLVVYDCLRYGKHNATTYNRLYQLSELTDNIIVTSEFPFKFDRRNLYIPMKMLRIGKYHYLQWYDDSFEIEKNGSLISANSIENFYSDYKNYIICDGGKFVYSIHEWNCTKKELVQYEDKKRRNIYDKGYSKIKLITPLQGFSNRFKSKINKLKKVINSGSIVITNWEVGNKEIKEQIPDCIPISYHSKEEREYKNNGNVYFFESIINQKIHFYDLLQKFSGSHLHFFLNNQLGADRNATSETVDIVKEINEFYSYGWETFKKSKNI
jgi:hypothetical protein